mgnify:CR=1 FL=1
MTQQNVSEAAQGSNQELDQETGLKVVINLPLNMVAHARSADEARLAGDNALKHMELEANAKGINATLEGGDLHRDGRIHHLSIKGKDFAALKSAFYWIVEGPDENAQWAGIDWAREIKDPAAVERLVRMAGPDDQDPRNWTVVVAEAALGAPCSEEAAVEFWKTVYPDKSGKLPDYNFVAAFIIGVSVNLDRFAPVQPGGDHLSLGCVRE